MQIIPAIDLLEGGCVRLLKGDYNKITRFNADPVAQALKWEEYGATRLHLVDLDAAKTGSAENNSAIRAIAKKLSIPIQVGGGIRSERRAEELINYGVSQVIIGTAALEEPTLVQELANKFPGKIIVGIDAKDGKVATRGWIEKTEVSAIDLVKRFNDTEIASIISTDISTDGTLQGPNLESLKSIASVSDIPVIASGGIGSLADIISLKPLNMLGITGVIVGRALYEGKIKLSEAIKVISNLDMEDSPDREFFYA